jgi:hypothetical protein
MFHTISVTFLSRSNEPSIVNMPLLLELGPGAADDPINIVLLRSCISATVFRI